VKQFLKKILLGITLPQEYLCVSLDDFEHSLKVYVKEKSSDKGTDITQHHLFIGYKPLIIAIDKNHLSENKLTTNKTLFLSFLSEACEELAVLEVKFIHETKLDPLSCLLFEGVKGIHSFTNHFNKLFNSIRYNFTADKKKNIFLTGNLYEQVKIAYSLPRIIYLASVGNRGLYNIFPTDLSGQLCEDNFIMSLRTNGKANEQIEKAGKCLVAKMEAGSFMEVYNAGRNHMRELSGLDTLGIKLSTESSRNFNFPVPLGAIQYFELEKIDMFEAGIHTIHFFRVTNTVELTNKKNILAHIHREYTEWRERNNIKTNFIIRN
jgi:hypothetical protein